MTIYEKKKDRFIEILRQERSWLFDRISPEDKEIFSEFADKNSEVLHKQWVQDELEYKGNL